MQKSEQLDSLPCPQQVPKDPTSLSFPGCCREGSHQPSRMEDASREDSENQGFWTSLPESESVGLARAQECAFQWDHRVIGFRERTDCYGERLFLVVHLSLGIRNQSSSAAYQV